MRGVDTAEGCVTVSCDCGCGLHVTARSIAKVATTAAPMPQRHHARLGEFRLSLRICARSRSSNPSRGSTAAYLLQGRVQHAVHFIARLFLSILDSAVACVHPYLPIMFRASFSFKICRARNTRERTAASLIPSVAATSRGDISSTVDRISGSRSFAGSAAISFSSTAPICVPGPCRRQNRRYSRLPRSASPDRPVQSRASACAFAAIDGDAPRDPRQPGLRISHVGELRTVAQHPHECFLCSILGIVMAAENGVRDAVDEAGVLSNQSFEQGVSDLAIRLRSMLALSRIASPATTRLPSIMKTAATVDLFRNF